MLYKKNTSILKYFALVSVITALAACSDDDVAGPVFDPDVPPQDVQVVAGDGNSTLEVQNTISWSDDPAATDHVVFWDNVTGVDENSGTIDVPDGFNYVVHSGPDVTAGNTLYYKVQALSGTQSSVLSGEVAGTPQESITANNLNDVAWDGVDTLIAVGDSGDIISSADGTADPWVDAKNALNPTAVSLSAVTWEGTTNNEFIIVGADGTVLTGSATSWTPQDSTVVTDLEDVKWIGNGYIAVGKDSTVITSTGDGSVWDEQTLPPAVTNVTFKGVATNGTRIVAVGTNGTLLTSDNMGVGWTEWTVTENNDLNDVTWDGVQFIVVGSDDTIYVSDDGAVWEKVNPQTPDIAFIGVTQWDSYTLPLPADPIPAVVGSAGTFVVFPDDTARLNIETGTTQQFAAVIFVDDGTNPAYFVMVGNDGFVLTSRLQ